MVDLTKHLNFNTPIFKVKFGSDTRTYLGLKDTGELYEAIQKDSQTHNWCDLNKITSIDRIEVDKEILEKLEDDFVNLQLLCETGMILSRRREAIHPMLYHIQQMKKLLSEMEGKVGNQLDSLT